MRNAADRRHKKESIAPDRRAPPPTPSTAAQENWQFLSTPVNRRDSDASFCSSRPSIAASGQPLNITDPSYKRAAFQTINSYLESHSRHILKPPLPSAKDITETLKFLVAQFGFDSKKLDEDLNYVLKFLKCPLKLNKSALRAPGTPHTWPNLLAVMHWLVQLIKYDEHSRGLNPSFMVDQHLTYTVKSYGFYIRGEDETMDELDGECMREMNEWKNAVEEEASVVDENVKELEGKVEGLKAGPSRKEALEQNKAVLEEDMMKFDVLIQKLNKSLVDLNKNLEEKDRAVEEKLEHRKRICDENEDLKRKIEEQGINSRDAERMKRELQATERNIEENETLRNGWEEKMWKLDSEAEHNLKDLEQLVMDCNLAIRRLKLGNGFQYQLDAKGSTSSEEVLRSDYKSVVKPALASFTEDIKKSSVEKLQESISLRQQQGEIAAKLEEKRNQMIALQSQIDRVEVQLNSMRKEAHVNASRCAAEAKRMVEDVHMEDNRMSAVEKEASDFLQTSMAQLQEVTLQTEEEVNACAQELFELINSASKHKEYVSSAIARARNDLVEAASAVADTYKGYQPLKSLDSSN